MEHDLQQLRALEAAVSEGSLDGAARRLHVTPSAVSQRLKALEIAAGQVLLVRSRPVRVTPAGQVLLRLARQVEMLAAEAAVELSGLAPGQRVRLTVAVNADSLGTWVLAALAPFTAEVDLDIRREDEDRTSQLLREGTVMAAVTTEPSPVPGCRVTPLGAMRYRAMAAPDLARSWFPDGATTAALSAAPVVLFDRDDDLQHILLRRHGVEGRPPTHYVPSSADHHEAVVLGMGWGMLPDLQSRDDERAGHLLDIAAGTVVDRELHWQQWRLRSTTLDRVADAVVGAARASLLPRGA